MAGEVSKIVIVGGTGYLGKYMVKASVAMGHPTFVYVRPLTPGSSTSKQELHRELQSMGVAIFKRFVPSEFGNEADRVTGLPPFQGILNNKKKIRRAIEAAKIPYTYVSANSLAAYFVDYLLHPREQREEVIVYGSGEAKAVLNFEEDVAAYTIKASTDPRTFNRVIIYRPPGNIISQLELISSWKKKSGRNLKKVHVPEEEIVKLSETLPHPDNIPVSILHNIFIKGDQMSFELREDDLEASRLYPDYKYTSVDGLLDVCLVDPPVPKLSVFA